MQLRLRLRLSIGQLQNEVSRAGYKLHPAVTTAAGLQAVLETLNMSMIVLLRHSRTIIGLTGQIEMGNGPGGRKLSEREDWDRSAEKYATFASRNGFYRYTTETMLQLAEIEPGMIVVDLACGTGSVTESILRQPYGEAVKIIAIDFSSRMLACARRRVTSGNVEFFCEKAENLSKVAKTKVDRILCNAAFWMFDKAQVLTNIRRVLKPSGKCLIGLHPRFRFSEIRVPQERNTVFWMILKEMAIRGYAITNRYGRSGRESQSDLLAKENCALAALDDFNLKLTRRERLAVHCTPREQIDFLRIPVMAKGSSLFADLPDREVREILDVVQNQVESIEVVAPPIPWEISILEVAESKHEELPGGQSRGHSSEGGCVGTVTGVRCRN